MKAKLTEFWKLYKSIWREDSVFMGFMHTLFIVYLILSLCLFLSGDSFFFLICAIFSLTMLLLAALISPFPKER